MPPPDAGSELVLELAEEFLARYRKGERPSLREYTDRHPDLAAEIREVFPALAMMENIAVADESLGGPAADAGRPAEPALRQLGDYRMIREIGHGGMGVVYEAEQVSLGRHVAVKLLPTHALLDARHKRRFEREARAAAKLHHTNIVPVFGVGEHDGVPYYVMQFIQGLGLDAVLRELIRLNPAAPQTPTGSPAGGGSRGPRADASAADVARSLMTGGFEHSSGSGTADHRAFAATRDYPAAGGPPGGGPAVTGSGAGRLSDSFSVSSSSVTLPGSGSGGKSARRQTYWQSTANIGRQVAEALEYAHKQGILHRDVKPSNLLLDLRGTVWVTDFGLAKVAGPGAEDLTHTGDILGTLRYMPPEAFEGRSDARSDVYSLGLTLYELLAMRPAFDEKDRNKLIKQVTAGEPAPLDKVRPGVPRDLVTIVHKAIAREPERRYATAEELAADLQRFLDDEPIQARRQTQVERYVRWARHHPGIATLAGVLAAVLVLATGASLVAAGYLNRLRLNEQAARVEADRSRQAEAGQRLTAVAERNRADDNARRAEERAGAARRAEEEATRQLSRAQWLVYAGKLSLAQTDFESGHGALALRYLDECRWELRGWEHRHLWTRVNAGLTVSHTGAVSGAAFSPDGTRVVTGSWGDETARVWDATTGRELLTLRHGVAVRGVAISPDGKRVATAAGDVNRPSEAKVWDAVTGRLLLTLTGHTGWVMGAAFSPDSTRLVTAAGDVFRPGEVKVWDAATGEELRTLRGHKARVWDAAFSPDGKRVVSVSGDGTAKEWDAESGRELRTFTGHATEATGVAYSPDGKRLVTASMDRSVKMWDAATGEAVLTLRGHAGWVRSAAFSPDGKHVVSAGADAAVRVWDAATGRELFALKGHNGRVNSAAYSPDGKRIVSGSEDHTARVWDAERGQKVLTLDGQAGPVHGVAFGPGGKHLCFAGGVWDAATGRKLVALNGAGRVRGVAFSRDGRLVATGSEEGTAKVWDARTGRELLTLRGNSGPVHAVAFSPDGTRLVTGAGDGRTPGGARVWDVRTGDEVLALRGVSRVWGVAYSPDGTRIVTGAGDLEAPPEAKVWDAATGRELLALKGHTSEVWAVAFSPDGTRVAAGGLDTSVRVWDAATGRPVLTLNGHTGGVWAVAFSPDGKRIFSGGEDDAVRVWDAGQGQELLALKGGATVHGLACSPDGTRLAGGGEDGAVRVWVADKGQPPRDDEERAEAMKDRLPAMLRGEDQPADTGERLILARYAFRHRTFAFAARCWAEALASDPKLGDDRATPHRYHAARAAALAAAGRGEGEPPPDEPGKAKLRAQALGWLTDELRADRVVLEAGPPREREFTLYRLSGWKRDPALAAVRDAADLPPEERGAIDRFWADHAALLDAANTTHRAFLEEALAKARETAPRDGSQLADILARLGRTYTDQERWTEAEPILRECLALREKDAPDSWATFNTSASLGGALFGQKRYAEAEPLLLKGYAGMKEREATIPPLGKDSIPEALDRLVDLYTATNRSDEAKKWQAERTRLLLPPMPGETK